MPLHPFLGLGVISSAFRLPEGVLQEKARLEKFPEESPTAGLERRNLVHPRRNCGATLLKI